MKKAVLAVAVVASLPVAAYAQTNVTLYGIVDAGVGWNDTDRPGDSSSMVVNSGYLSTSRFGMRGSEDLGGGLKATFNLEAGVDIDTGSSETDTGGTFFARRSVVGLAGRFGEVRLGRDYTPGFYASKTADVPGLYANWLTFVTQGGQTARTSNGIHYTGTFAGFRVRAVYADGESPAPDSSAGDVWGLAADYASGPLNVHGYYQEVTNGGGIATKQTGVGAGYKFGAFRVVMNFGIADADTGGTVRAGIDRLQGLGLGAVVKVGTGELITQVIRLDGDSTTAAADQKATVFGIGYVHPLSKRTHVYATYGMARNNGTANFNVRASDTAVAAGAAGADPKGFAVGMRHLF